MDDGREGQPGREEILGFARDPLVNRLLDKRWLNYLGERGVKFLPRWPGRFSAGAWGYERLCSLLHMNKS